MESIEESSLMAKEKDMGHLNGTMVKYSKANGKTVPRMGLELGNHPKEIFMRANGG